jgi:hypothetical protein
MYLFFKTLIIYNLKEKSEMWFFLQFSANNSKRQFKKFKNKIFLCKNDTAKKSIKDHIYIYTTPRKMVICDNDGMTGDHI